VAKRDESAWRYAIDEVALEDFGVALTDYSQPSKLAYNFDGIRVLVKNITNDGKTPIAVDARLNVREGGSLQMSATAPQTFDAAQAKIQLDRFDLRQLQPFLSQYAALKLGGADLSAEMAVDFRQANPQPSVKAAGNVRLDGLSLKEIKEDRKFLAWKSLALNGLNLTLAPDKLTIKEIRIVRPDATVSIYKDRSTNIAAIFKTQRTNGAAPAAQPAKGAPAAGATGSKRDGTKPFPVTVERVRIDDGLVDFSDLSLVIPFATKIHDFHGSASGISMTPKNRASMKFSGRVGQFGETKVDGSLSPMQVLDFADVNVTFRNVAMSDLSPYSATFAGRAIKSGKLNLDLLYKIQGRQLKSQNKVELQDFTLGDAVESPNSTNLPLDLAIALLTDSQGKISASVPIEGTVDDPKFDYGALVWDAFVKLITNVVSAPFNAVAAMFGDGEQHYDAILFEPGKAALPPPEREKLLKIAGALQSRPKLKLVVHGHYDSTRDGDAMKSLKLRRELAEQLDTALAPGEEPDAVAYGDAAAQRALEKMAEASAGGGVLEAAQGDYLKQTGKPAQRVGKFAGLMGQPSETPDFYEMLFKRMIAAAPLAQADLETLAQRRSKAVLDELVQRRRIEPSRITEGKAEPTDRGTEQGVPSGLELVAE
jgi:outer membrane protein OmpA-like peptidoglycan-associated protein